MSFHNWVPGNRAEVAYGGVVDWPRWQSSASEEAICRLDMDRGILRRGADRIVVLSGTEHHGIEAVLSGPVIIAQSKREASW